MKKITIGVLAHVDAGKTTLLEALLYKTKAIRKLGRVDKGDAYLDDDANERDRGITIYSKNARIDAGDKEFIFIDTPGHGDFSPEMERTLWVLDYVILLTDGSCEPSPYLHTLFRLVSDYGIPVFIFVNKWDRKFVDERTYIDKINVLLKTEAVNFNNMPEFEELATLSEALLEEFVAGKSINDAILADEICAGNVIPVYFGSALKLEGIDEFIEGLVRFTRASDYGAEFGARVYKCIVDKTGNQAGNGTPGVVAFMRITGGSLRVRDEIGDEKVTHLRIYNGSKYVGSDKAESSDICAVTGISGLRPGMGLGFEKDCTDAHMIPFMEYKVEAEGGNPDAFTLYNYLKPLDLEDPSMGLKLDEYSREVKVNLMGSLQKELLITRLKEEHGVTVSFSMPRIVYAETIDEAVEGMGHFEPLRHYAEVHLLMEPLERNSGIKAEIAVKQENRDRGLEKSIISLLTGRNFRGVLTGSRLTDVKFILKSYRTTKHTQPEDMRKAVIRAVRQGLMSSANRLLEPYMDFNLRVPTVFAGRALTDIERFSAKGNIIENDTEYSLITGTGPLSGLWDYGDKLKSYSGGRGSFEMEFAGFGDCIDPEAAQLNIDYDPLSDPANPAVSLFHINGQSTKVLWNEVGKYMDLPSVLEKAQENEAEEKVVTGKRNDTIAADEIDRILNKTYNANRRENKESRGYAKTIDFGYRGKETPVGKRKPFLLVDGYNVIFANDELSKLANDDLYAARQKLTDMLDEYKSLKNAEIMLVFDGYKTGNTDTSYEKWNSITVVYTKHAQTADSFIENFAHVNAKEYHITVATSDGLEQIIIRGEGCALVSSRELIQIMEAARSELRESSYLNNEMKLGNTVIKETQKDLETFFKK